ncbi:MAG: hypothetical protein HY275_11840 [Gemmatimonadetes bacterium]|nr:hypothetical protein [Gemmatimonadota bacterium]
MSSVLEREATFAPAKTGSRANVATATGFIATILGSAAGIVIGLLWDISWHMTVGRDTFWSPPHLLEYVSGVTAGIACGFVVLRTTFAGSEDDRAASVRFWGFTGPLGAWITIWGTFAMLLSAPFDDWWHNAYGLDVKIVSPPHMVLLSGMLGIMLGALVLTVSAQNRSAGKRDELRDAWLYAAAGGVLCFILACATLEYSWPNEQHRALYYQVWASVFPVLLAGYASAGRLRWPATGAALVYMLLWLGMGWGLRLVEAHPMLAPIYNARTYMWPPYFPVWLVAPAFAMDLVLQRMRGRNAWLVALALGTVFVATHVAVQYPWSIFMLSPGARNAVFNGGEFPYTATIGKWTYEFWGGPRNNRTATSQLAPTVFAQGLLIAVLLGTLSSRLGLAWGGWMARVKR